MASCQYCGRQVIISSLSSLRDLLPGDLKAHVRTYQDALAEQPRDPGIALSLGMCYLGLGLYDQAQQRFEAAIDDDLERSETYFYAAITLLRGKKAFLTPLATIRAAEAYIEAALKLEDRGIYSYFFAYLRYDYYERKSLNCSPSWADLLQQAIAQHVTDEDVRLLFDLLRVNPAALPFGSLTSH
ncbi:tetratricopeptide repeat protein [Modestobacter lapidis]|nr:tetratricopeptide repeat protein [Modestobacter lapidis]